LKLIVITTDNYQIGLGICYRESILSRDSLILLLERRRSRTW